MLLPTKPEVCVTLTDFLHPPTFNQHVILTLPPKYTFISPKVLLIYFLIIARTYPLLSIPTAINEL
jgi:hypothetical protein